MLYNTPGSTTLKWGAHDKTWEAVFRHPVLQETQVRLQKTQVGKRMGKIVFSRPESLENTILPILFPPSGEGGAGGMAKNHSPHFNVVLPSILPPDISLRISLGLFEFIIFLLW